MAEEYKLTEVSEYSGQDTTTPMYSAAYRLACRLNALHDSSSRGRGLYERSDIEDATTSDLCVKIMDLLGLLVALFP